MSWAALVHAQSGCTLRITSARSRCALRIKKEVHAMCTSWALLGEPRYPSIRERAGFVDGAVPPTVPGPIVAPGVGAGTGFGGRGG
jgi:hypothetical protein